jgi:hypothetical protein
MLQVIIPKQGKNSPWKETAAKVRKISFHTLFVILVVDIGKNM